MSAQAVLQDYRAALRDYVAHPDEVILERAYQLGRQVLGDDRAILDLVVTYHEELSLLLRASQAGDEQERILALTQAFLAESLAPVAMAQRSFRDTLDSLRAEREAIRLLNMDLEERIMARTVDLATANNQLMAVNQELEAFSYSVSHDLRTPLRAISGFADILRTSYSVMLDEQGGHYLQRILTGATQMGHLIEDLLALSRLSRTDMHTGPVDLTGLAGEVAETLRQCEPERRVTWDIAEGLTAYGDVSLLRVVLDNLLGNAWKFTSKHPTARIEVGMRQEEGETVYFVGDDGAGFDMAYADKLFGAFQRLHHAREFEGTGIGLATVQRIIHRHGGRVWAEGAVEHGTTISFTLAAPGGDQYAAEELDDFIGRG